MGGEVRPSLNILLVSVPRWFDLAHHNALSETYNNYLEQVRTKVIERSRDERQYLINAKTSSTHPTHGRWVNLPRCSKNLQFFVHLSDLSILVFRRLLPYLRV